MRRHREFSEYEHDREDDAAHLLDLAAPEPLVVEGHRRCPPCPVHGLRMIERLGKYGRHSFCPEPGCDIKASRSKDRLWRLSRRHLRALREEAHRQFDPLWRSGRMERTHAYAWMANTLGIPRLNAHIQQLSAAGCLRLIAAVKEYANAR